MSENTLVNEAKDKQKGVSIVLHTHTNAQKLKTILP